MTLFEWVWSRWRNGTQVPGTQLSVTPMRTTPRVPAEYLSLHTYLDRRYASLVVLTFDEMESLLGCALPALARTSHDWWLSAATATDRHSDAWTAAHRTASPNFQAGNVTFERRP